jgi:putative ABC transport system permease protein
VDPVKALQKGRYQIMSEGESRARQIAAVTLLAFAAACLWLGTSNNAFYAGYMTVIASLVLLSPALAQFLAKAIRPLWKLIRPVEGVLAADSLIQSPRRTSATVSALMLSLALAVGFSGIAGAIHGSVLTWMDTTLNPDLFIAPTQTITNRDFRFPAELEQQIEAIPEVAEAQAVRSSRMMIKGIPALGIAVPIEGVNRRIKPIVVEGDLQEMIRLGAAGKGIIISDSLANIRNIHKGEVIELDSPGGRLLLPVLGTTVDFSDQQGSFLMEKALYEKYWSDTSVNVFRVYLKPGSNTEAVKEKILAQLGRNRRMFVFTNASLREYILTATAQWFGLTYVQLAVALLVAVLGIVNTLTVSISDRRRELGILQAVGGLRSQVRQTIWLEAIAIGLIGLILGLAMGAVTLYYNVDMLRRDMAGLRLEYQYPYAFAAALLPVILGCAFLASIWPAEAAVRRSLVESLEYE